ncbi:hypothetical protein [Vulcanisaeta souniana]|uniref:Uncharacterized protein n=2 Tax=Vulcanisaeta souniana TaxID=164452 RepID=A0A830DYI4_9CREN|nr:hypothetical protein [Vulcanisaeta souniana]BDR91948.1 hypothetical protein Vsou_10410 [Vulcanisaeta souniana JCM 11219]GGI69118.1 hypothetical protein GCM10007112_02630 [Vulcanisaeta souniana JCM 11219]
MRIRTTTLLLYYPTVLIIVAMGMLIAVLIPSYYALLPEFIMSLLFIYTLGKLHGKLGIGYSYVVTIILIVLLSYASVFLIRPSLFLNKALIEMKQSLFRGSLYLVTYLFLSLLPDSATDLVGTLPIFLLVTAIAVLELRLRHYVLAGILTGIVGIGVSTVVLSLMFNRVIVTYGLSAMTMGLMGLTLMASLINTVKRPGRLMHFLNFLIILYTVYESIWLLIPIPPVLIIGGVGINRLGHFISMLAGIIIAIFIT